MTWSGALALFAAMAVFAITPGPGVMLVVARTMASGFLAGVVTSIGLLLGDYVYIIFAVYGLSSLSQFLGEFFLLVKYVGAAYLILLGITTAFPRKSPSADGQCKVPRHSTNFLAGLLTTLSNPKAMLFYISFFPAFFDLSSVSHVDVLLILVIAAFAVGGMMILYAYIVEKTGTFMKDSAVFKRINYLAAVILISGGVFIGLRS